MLAKEAMMLCGIGATVPGSTITPSAPFEATWLAATVTPIRVVAPCTVNGKPPAGIIRPGAGLSWK